MDQQPIALAYCIDNVQLAEQIDQELSSVGWKPQHYYGPKSSPSQPLFEQLASHGGPILLLVTDNFLRSVHCMAGALEFIQENREAILTVVAEGSRQDEARNLYHVPTQFERISDIIQYINYWQEQYLDLRRQKRELKDELDESTFNEHLRLVRSISGEISELLRLLPNTEYLTFEELEEEHYESVFRLVNDLESWEQLKSLRTSVQREAAPVVLSSRSVLPESPPAQSRSESREIAEVPASGAAEAPSQMNGNHHELSTVTTVESAEHQINEPVIIPEKEASFMETLSPKEVLEQVNDQLNQGNTAAAIAQLHTAVAAYPKHPALRYQLAHLLAQSEAHFNDARQHLHALLEHDPQHTAALFLLGELAELEQNFSEAAERYQEVVEIDDRFPEVHYRLGLLLAHQFEDTQDKALAAFEQAVEQDEENADAHYQYGILLNEYRHDQEAAIEQFERTLALLPDHPFAFYDLALIYHAQGEVEKAQWAYLQAAVVNPEVRTPENDQAFSIDQSEKESIISPVSPLVDLEIPEVDSAVEPIAPAQPVQEEAGPEEPSAVETDEVELTLDEADDYLEPLQTPDEDTPAVESDLIDLRGIATDPKVAATAQSSIEHDALAALKENIERLEQMIQARDQEKDKLKQQRPGQGQTVLITGATAGIGRATAEEFARHGYRVIMTGRRADRLKDLQQRFAEEYETEVQALSFDVRDVKSVKEAIESLPTDWSEIDILINNAGKAKGLAPIHEGQLEHWEEMIDTNIKGLLYLTRAVAPGMVKRGRGHIINISSMAGKEFYPQGNVYCATKAAVDALTKTMRIDLYKHNVRVSQISPAHVEETEFAEVRFDGDRTRASKVYEDFQPLRAGDVAAAAYFIASRPEHVNVLDVMIQGTQQASSTMINRSGRE